MPGVLCDAHSSYKRSIFVLYEGEGLNWFHWIKKNKVSRSLNESWHLLSICPLAHWTVALWALFAVNLLYP